MAKSTSICGKMSFLGAPSTSTSLSTGGPQIPGSNPVGVSSAGEAVVRADNNHNRLPSVASGTALLFPSLSTGNSNSRNSATVDLDGISLFDDVDFSDKPKEITDCLDDLADLIEEKSVKPMLAAVAPANMMISAASGVPGQQQSTVVCFHGV